MIIKAFRIRVGCPMSQTAAVDQDKGVCLSFLLAASQCWNWEYSEVGVMLHVESSPSVFSLRHRSTFPLLKRVKVDDSKE